MQALEKIDYYIFWISNLRTTMITCRLLTGHCMDKKKLYISVQLSINVQYCSAILLH